MSNKPTYKELEQRIKELEQESVFFKDVDALAVGRDEVADGQFVRANLVPRGSEIDIVVGQVFDRPFDK